MNSQILANARIKNETANAQFNDDTITSQSTKDEVQNQNQIADLIAKHDEAIKTLKAKYERQV